MHTLRIGNDQKKKAWLELVDYDYRGVVLPFFLPADDVERTAEYFIMDLGDVEGD
jgi:hypothetical protein